jgi:uncharacterized protein YutE (UPF0331/DUF86 family)
MIDDVVLNKKESVERCVAQIRDYYAKPSELSFAEDHLKQDAIAINLQRGIEQCLDLANHVARVKKLGIPKKSSDVFGMLADAEIIDRALCGTLQAMVGFRNVLVHEYQKLAIAVMIDVIENRLDDMIALTNRIIEAS